MNKKLAEDFHKACRMGDIIILKNILDQNTEVLNQVDLSLG